MSESYNPEFLKLIFMLLLPLAIVLLVVAITQAASGIKREDRQYLDPLSGKMRLIWPLVRFFSHYVGDFLPVELIERLNKKLNRAGMRYLMSPEQLVGLQMTSALLVMLVCWLCLAMLEISDPLLLGLAALLGYFMPMLSINDLRNKRERQMIKALPTYLDFLTMAIQAGMNFSGAIIQAVEKGPDGPLKSEFSKVVRDTRAGMSRPDALRAMANRLDMGPVTTFVNAVLQAEKSGASVGETLKIQADQRRTERFQIAEKQAMQAPVKLIFPLVAFIFPVTFIIIFFPIGMMLLESF